MAVLDLPRLQFRGLCRVHAPTGNNNRGGHIDIASNTVFQDGRPFPIEAPADRFHAHIAAYGQRYDANGQPDSDGIFNTAAGWDQEGNGHCSWEGVKIVGAQTRLDHVDTDPNADPVIGTTVDLWGHYNPYLGTTFNRARWVELDPSSRWTNQVFAGLVTIGRKGSSVDQPAMVRAGIKVPHAARWRKSRHIIGLPPHLWRAEFARAELFQFSVAKDDDDFGWEADAAASPALRAFATALSGDDVAGLVFQYTLSNMSAPTAPNMPVFFEVTGTVGLWRRDELATYPTGRLLVPAASQRGASLGNITLMASSEGLSLYLGMGLGHHGRQTLPASPLPWHPTGPVEDLGDLMILSDGEAIATIPAAVYSDAITGPRCGIVDVTGNFSSSTGALSIVGEAGTERLVLFEEQEWVVEADASTLTLDMPDYVRGDDHRAEVEVRSFHRGQPARHGSIAVRAFRNPHGVPDLDPSRTTNDEEPSPIVRLRSGRRDDDGAFTPALQISTDAYGRGWLTVLASAAGSARLWLNPGGRGTVPLKDGPGLDVEIFNYDNDDQLSFWGSQGSLFVRTLPDDWWLADVPEDEVDFAFLYEHVLAYYELVYPFMKSLVFSLADECKCETYARLMWQMCDPRNRNLTYYMPPTRELSLPKSELFLKYLRSVEPSRVILPCA